MRKARLCTIALFLLGAGCAGDQDTYGSGAALSEADEERGRGGPDDLVVADGGVVLDCVPGPIGEIHVEFDCDSVTIHSCKDLSNVVLEFEDGERQRFEGLSGQVDAFAGTDEHEGERIVRVWVKAGANFSGDGPGYGERFEAPEDDCDTPPPDEGDGDPVDPCQDSDPDTVCGGGEVPPGEDDEPSEEQGGDPLSCSENPDDPACQVD